MSENKKSKNNFLIKLISFILYISIIVIGGIVISKKLDLIFQYEMNLWLRTAIILASIYASLLISIIFHETGHLIFGLITGYKLCSFRILNLILIRKNDKIKLKRIKIAGTGGQCLMAPPDFKNGKIPVMLFNFGGAIMNLIATAIFFALSLIFENIPWLSFVFTIVWIFNFLMAVTNGVPMRSSTIDNDGYNTISLGKNKEAMRAFWIQLKVNEQNTNGVRLKDMPSEWFEVPTDEQMQNNMLATIGVFATNRLMDELDFQEADKLMSHMLSINSGMTGLHKGLMICDKLFIELINENRKDVLNSMLTIEQKKFVKSMKSFPSVLRTEYAYALLCEKDVKKAEIIKANFDKIAKTYPYEPDITSEIELMEIAKSKA